VGRLSGRHLAHRPGRRTGSWIGAVLGVVAVLGGAGILLLRDIPAKSLACPSQTISLTLVSSPDKAPLLQQAAQDFSRANPRVNGRCISVRVAAKQSGDTARALAAGWNPDDGPRPDVWSPSSSLWAGLLQQRLQAGHQPNLLPGERPQIASSPMVIAMPKPMAQALGWPSRQLGLADVLGALQHGGQWRQLGHPEWGAFLLGKTDANNSAPGLEAALATFSLAARQAGAGQLSTQAIGDRRVQATALDAARAPGPFARDPGTFLADLQQADDANGGRTYVSAVALDEKAVLDYNAGNPSGDPAQTGHHPKPKVPLAAIYPKEGTLVADHPFLVLTASWVDGPKRRAAADLLHYLQSAPVQNSFKAAGFRSFTGAVGTQVTTQNGLVPGQPATVLPQPPPAVTNAALQAWNAARQRGNVLAVIDVSASMSVKVPGTGQSRLGLVTAAAAHALSLFDDQDFVGVWAFSSRLDGARDYRQLVALGAMGQDLGDGSTRRQAVGQGLQQLRPSGNTALYDTVAAAYQFMQAHFVTGRINSVVLLTDGGNDKQTGLTLPVLLEQLKVGQESRPVRIVTIGVGPDADGSALGQIADVTGGTFYASRNPADIGGTFIKAVTSF
jgi:Ca-activated chloride channel homolog